MPRIENKTPISETSAKIGVFMVLSDSYHPYHPFSNEIFTIFAMEFEKKYFDLLCRADQNEVVFGSIRFIHDLT